MPELQSSLDGERFTSSAGGGVVTAVVDGRQRLKEIKIDPAALRDGDASLLEDLVITAVAEAQRASETQMNERMGSITGGFNLPF
jgi:DNA-binding YbaB/EbfC family protein